jgi:hypothetical protein
VVHVFFRVDVDLRPEFATACEFIGVLEEICLDGDDVGRIKRPA